ncbi:SurA N-terminal domain-containing protein [Sphingorhabdus arenilitoris]|uniref:Parvulin-like PPIase n=1 Tax=Sphingorhabdus arenilitoris TaxID=1490041 RepID=A0ABV8RFH2_9SPHN
MISFFRKLFSSKFGTIFALVFVGLIAVAFTLGDVTGSGSFGGLGGGNVAKVGNKNITLGEFTDAVDNRLRAERQQNPNLDMARFVEGGGFDATLQNLIDRYAISVFGEETGIAVSKRMIDAEILKIPGAKGLDGKFSQEAFQAFLGQIGLSEKSFREGFTQQYYIQQILPATEGRIKTPSSYVLPYASLQLEQRSGELGFIPSAAYAPQKDATDAELAKYYRENSTRFTIPEQRAVSYVLFDDSIVAELAKPTAKEIADYYAENKDAYAASEARDITRFVVPTEAAAKAAIDQVNAGKSLEAVAQGLGLSVTKDTNVTRQALTGLSSKAVADAVFAAPKGQIAKPARASLGFFVARVTDVRATPAKTLAQATPEITQLLETEKAATVLSEYTTEIEDAFANGTSLADVAKERELKVETTPKLFATGQNPADPNYRPRAEMAVILPAAFQMEEGGEAQLIEIEKGKSFAMISLAEVKKAAPPPLAEVRAVIMQQWKMAKGSEKAKAAAEQVQKAVNSGKSLADAMKALNIKTPPTESIKGSRAELKQENQNLPPPLLLLFSMKQGTAKKLDAPNNAGWLIVKLNQIIKGDASKNAELIAAKTAELTELMSQEQGAALVNAAAKQVGVKKNDSVIAAQRKRLTSNDNK